MPSQSAEERAAQKLIELAGLEEPAGGYAIDGYAEHRTVDDDLEPALVRAHFTAATGGARAFVIVKAWPAQDSPGGFKALAHVSLYPRLLAEFLTEQEAERLRAASLEYNAAGGPKRLERAAARKVAIIKPRPAEQKGAATDLGAEPVPYAPPVPALPAEDGLTELPPELAGELGEGFGTDAGVS